ncbi:uncharacterized protein LOC115427118 [Sphaeramia orbicularis]|uniref:uncharacterized protein LOC115427118 n=1 Tax=Sphaeramia orbicularis TaxID=375764 RepID=UPI00117D15B3|nr:uncharacterized protein LOC115427118 [Sphaeramia orbicularis]
MLRKRLLRPRLPSMFMTNGRSIIPKMDELELLTTENVLMKNCSVMFITETWLHPQIPDAAAELVDRTLHRYDKTKESGRTRGGGLCVYVHSGWCINSKIIEMHCSPNVEILAVSWRPFYLPRQLTVAILIAVYIPLDANVSNALSLLLTVVNKQRLARSDGVSIVAGDFNQACLRTVLKLVQYVHCATRGDKTLDHVQCNIKHAYTATPLPHLSKSDHFSLSLTSTYTTLRTKPETMTINTCPEGALSQLQDCSSRTLWDLFDTDTVLCYIKNCTDMVTVNTDQGFCQPETLDDQ